VKWPSPLLGVSRLTRARGRSGGAAVALAS